MKSKVELNRSGRVLFIGNPSAFTEVTEWATMKQWAAEHGLELTRDPDGDMICAIATEDVLDGMCSPSDAMAMQRTRVRGVPCVSVHDARRIWDTILFDGGGDASFPSLARDVAAFAPHEYRERTSA